MYAQAAYCAWVGKAIKVRTVMASRKKERRQYTRYDTEAKIYFCVHYDLKTKVEFQLIKRFLSKKYFGLSRNVSVEGLRFSSDKQLRKNDNLYVEVYLPKRKEPVWMLGEVRWSKKIAASPKEKYHFDTGVKITSVMDKPVSRTIYFDKQYQVFWSVVLDYVFGSFRKYMRGQRK